MPPRRLWRSVRGASTSARPEGAMRVVGYYDELPGFIDSLYRTGTPKKDVNDGSRPADAWLPLRAY